MDRETKEKHKCKSCGIKFEPTPQSEGIYCDKRCADEGHRKGRRVKCAGCGKIIYRKKCHLKKSKTSVCNRDCQTKSLVIDSIKIYELHKQGLSCVKIGKILEISHGKVHKLLTQYKLGVDT